MDINKIKNNNCIKLLTEDLKFNSGAKLVGGAVIDLLEDRIPKDYDIKMLINDLYIDKLLDKGYKYICETKTAYTFTKNEFIIQFLKTEPKDFEFKISQASYNFKKEELYIDKVSFNNKILIPTTFDNPKIAKECLFRIPHWKRKGYSIHDMTYLSLLNVVIKSNNILNKKS